MGNGRFGFVINAQWLRQWHSFVGLGPKAAASEVRPPGPIDNTCLLDPDGAPHRGLRRGGDYGVLDPPVWELYARLYGGGPALVRYSATSRSPDIDDVVVDFKGEWRHLRPDTGEGKVFDPSSGRGFDGALRGGCLWSGSGNGLLATGSHFEGCLQDGLPEGPGREVRPDGTAYEGTFVGGKLHGRGHCTGPDGRQMEGEWDCGELAGI
eukprot:NODE_3271_length_809_cov_220.773210.p1 GENE.NODE_3271_length_809_cov_220.773210~~NODE_3271_length_809_cov_220.773210.p1  ORF type:complete len:209 (-),score=48.69 NODE_3271_length_809_cov_220.773210:165-791(-)